MFYVQTALGEKIENDAKLKRTREKLLEALGETEPAPAGKPEKARDKAAKASKPATRQAAKGCVLRAAKSTGAAAE